MKKTKARVIIVALACVIAGLLLLWVSTGTPSPWNAVVATLATVIVTIGVVNVISDLYLQQTISDDLISLIQSDRRLIDAGVDGLARVEDADWTELLSSDYQVNCAVLDPTQFKALIWPRLLDAAKTRLRSVEIAVVDVADIARLTDVPARLGVSSEDYAQGVLRLEAELEKEWKALKAASASKCGLTIRRAASMPRYAYINTPVASAIIIEPLDRSTGLVNSFVLNFRTERRGNQYAAWLTDAIAAVRARYTAPVYTDVQEDQSPHEEL